MVAHPNQDCDPIAILTDFFTNPTNTDIKLDLSSCKLKTIPACFDALITANPTASARLEQLNLAHNALTTLPFSLSKLPSLRILFLLSNAFSVIPPVIAHISSLRMLSFKSNFLSGELQASSLPPQLTWLILTSNSLTGLSPDFPSRCRYVRKLMLSNNHLSSLPSLSTHMHDLELVRLANNRLSAIPSGLLNLPALKWLALAANPGICPAADPTQFPPTQRVSLEDFHVQWDTPLGTGASGAAYAATHLTSGAKAVAKRFRGTEGSDGRILDELSVSLAAADVKGLLTVHGWAIGSNDTLPVLLLERVNGDVHALANGPSFDSCTRSVYNKKDCFTKDEVDVILHTVQRAVRELWKRGICHGDLYAHNVLIARDAKGFVARLGDLGAAWFVPEELREAAWEVEKRALDVLREELLARVERSV